MNILEAEEAAEKLKPPYSYITATVYGKATEFEKRLQEYAILMERISEAKLSVDLQAYYDILEANNVAEEFYSTEDLLFLYKENIEDKTLQKCRDKIKESELIKEAVKMKIQELKRATHI